MIRLYKGKMLPYTGRDKSQYFTVIAIYLSLVSAQSLVEFEVINDSGGPTVSIFIVMPRHWMYYCVYSLFLALCQSVWFWHFFCIPKIDRIPFSCKCQDSAIFLTTNQKPARMEFQVYTSGQKNSSSSPAFVSVGILKAKHFQHSQFLASE